MPTFDALVSRGDAHTSGDCSHYASDTNIWEPVHLSLLMILKNKTLYNSSIGEGFPGYIPIHYDKTNQQRIMTTNILLKTKAKHKKSR